MRTISSIALVCLICLGILIVPSARAEILRVPGDVPTLCQAFQLADRGDVIELAVGVHKLVGREIVLKPGIVVRTDTGMPGGVVLKESGCFCGDWRDRPVFVMADGGDPVRFEGITFADFTLSCGPAPYIGNPVFHVLDGLLKFDRCRFVNSWKTIAWFDGGSGRFEDCRFEDGCGCAGAIHFAGERLLVKNTIFSGYEWLEHGPGFQGNILDLVAGEISLVQTTFQDNGPLVQLVTVGADAELSACSSCFLGNATIWEGEVAGRAVLDCCEVDPGLWNVLPGGDLKIIGDLDITPVGVEKRSLSAVKSLFR
jgi:hypothetical protein